MWQRLSRSLLPVGREYLNPTESLPGGELFYHGGEECNQALRFVFVANVYLSMCIILSKLFVLSEYPLLNEPLDVRPRG